MVTVLVLKQVLRQLDGCVTPAKTTGETSMPTHRSSNPLIVLTLMALASVGTLLAEPAGMGPWARITEDDNDHQDRDRKTRSRHPQEEPQAVDDRHRKGIVSR